MSPATNFKDDEIVAPPPPDGTPMTLYEGSSQFQHWRFSRSKLAAMRTTLSTAAVAAVREAIERDNPGSSSEITFLTPQDEHTLVKLYIGRVGGICAALAFPEEVEATAISYIKRFYLKNTAMDWHPKDVMLTALFLATKTTNNPVALDEYAKRCKTTPADILRIEFLLAQSLRFEFAVWHAHRALWGMFLDLQILPDVEPDVVKLAYKKALDHARASRLTDAELIYTPSQIALACLLLANPMLARQWARAKSEEAAVAIIEPIVEMVERDGVQPDIGLVTTIDRNLKLCKNPEKIPGSRAYLARQAEQEAAAAAKRAKKAQDTRAVMEANNPFGDDLGEGSGDGPSLFKPGEGAETDDED
ncbi:hypothetical protein BOTBODRAFT_34025 [Botryobasidium botryosum FD-172 SS1]|uniref:Cyclin-like domain-containing protein n=1 Tax=Botryobasidium botryosum (strain FD-172 SS1) TaxID=930990 RepID=A0A067MAW2_BOTB1|nr:hypothetical protein BOTBODRAFT_34025 [Botryobasidium botryosum FD-172 SS1]